MTQAILITLPRCIIWMSAMMMLLAYAIPILPTIETAV